MESTKGNNVDKLVRENIRLVQFIVNKFYPPAGSDYDDLFQIGCLGLVKAANMFDPSKGKFAAIAALSITSEIYRAIEKSTALKRTAEVLSIDYTDEFDNALLDSLASSECVEDEVEAKFLTEHLIAVDPELTILVLQGYNKRDIRKRLGMSPSNLSMRMDVLKQQAAGF